MELGLLKAKEPEALEKLRVTIAGSEYTVDVGSDIWGRAVALVSEVRNGRRVFTALFYGIGRGLQRALQMKLPAMTSDILLIDEIENSLHPELAGEVAASLAQSVGEGKQIIATTQSLEMATMLASAALDGEVTSDRDELLERLVGCHETRMPLSLVVLNREGREVRSLILEGCEAARHIAGMRDPRLSYRLLA